MEYYEDIVKKRNSCRGFSERKVEDDVLTELLTYYEEDESDLVDEIETELKFYIGTVWDELKRSVGYNGFCIKAPAYMVMDWLHAGRRSTTLTKRKRLSARIQTKPWHV